MGCGGSVSKKYEAQALQMQADLSGLQASLQKVESAMESERKETRSNLNSLHARMQRQRSQFSVGQYNILAGYLGNNTEPWFLYGVEMTPERRKEIMKLFSERGPDGKPVNAGWPNYVRGVLSEQEQTEVERIGREHFAWDKRKDRLVTAIRDLGADVMSIVECDNYENFFKPELEKLGYDSIWKQRPRAASKDGCCVAWKRDLFELVAETSVDYVDKYCPETQKTSKDRIALMALLRMRFSQEIICFVSTHLARNPELPELDRLRARQIGQVMRNITSFVQEHDKFSVPVVLTGDLNATCFGRLRGIANAVALLEEQASVHPFTFDCVDVPTGTTSVTTARNVRIDAILYQSNRLELVDINPTAKLSTAHPIPNEEHPSDHIAIGASFCLRSRLQVTHNNAREWYLQLAGRGGSLPLDGEQLKEAFQLYDHDGEGRITQVELQKAISNVMGSGVASVAEVAEVLSQLPADGADLDSFNRAYAAALAKTGLPGLEDFRDAFSTFDKDKSGALDFKEVQAVFAECSPVHVPEGCLEDLFKRIDTSGDGLIVIDEFLAHLSSVWSSKFRRRSLQSMDE